ncbi:hypothetical protein DTO96_102211 [Ephemeroptericola cinctiostellae]|uniref:Uncharacterized protein n=1 Tax=Ephemeroptericola cinctiostellae TaxID=2268024 RepID=A0A345DDL9_9BURK|nr:hypothetical protein [Ephemeroptericola cinctiostellae]AXF86457.1 hypothetical protein DTO96_102211 [Ephemeroptericola cinctiostellae]
MNNMVKKTAVVMVVFALLGSPFGALLLWLPTLLWAVFNQSSDVLNILGSAPAILFVALFSYFVGLIPALFAGLLFAVWYVRQVGLPSPWKMVLIGSMCGGAVALVLQLNVFVIQSIDWFAQSFMWFFTCTAAGALCAWTVDLFQIND